MHEAANALKRVHKASTQNQRLRTKTSKISMSQRDNRKSCHSDQLSSQQNRSRGMIWGNETLTFCSLLAPSLSAQRQFIQFCSRLVPCGVVLTHQREEPLAMGGFD